MADVKELNINNTTYTIKDAVARSGLTAKQNTLVSGTNIKTINGQSVLGSGDLQTPYRNIGEIVASTLPLTDAGLHLLDGALIDGSGVYSAFVTYISGLVSDYPDLFVTEADWQTSVNTYGVCGKFVYTNEISATMPSLGTLTGTRNPSSDMDAGSLGMRYAWNVPELGGDIFTVSETPSVGDAIWVYQNGSWTNSGVNIEAVNYSVRLPKITGKLEGTTDVSALGDLAEQYVKLPNITGHWRQGSASYGTIQVGGGTSGAFYKYGSQLTHTPQFGDTDGFEIGFDASLSSSVYSGNGSDTEIHEQAIKCYYYIVIATSTKTDIQVDIDEVVTDLNGKADVDLTNVTDVANIKMAHNAMPSNSYINLTLGASGSTYTAPADGWVTVVLTATASNGWGLLTSDERIGQHCFWPTTGGSTRAHIPVVKGSTFALSYGGARVNRLIFIYAQGSESEAL